MHRRFNRQKFEAASFCSLALVAISSMLFCFQKPAVSIKYAEEPVICMPVINQADLKLSSYKEESVSMAAPVYQARAIPARDVASLSRGVRASGETTLGLASWYGGADGLDGMPTASGEIFNADAYTAAHRTLPFGTMVRVTFLKTGKSVVVRINDRGPFIPGYIIDLSRAAAAVIGLVPYGVGKIQLEIQ